MGRTADYYHSHPAAYAKKQAMDKKINARPEQIRKRVDLVQIRRKAGVYGNHDGKDYDHKQGKFMSASKNRGQREKSRVPGYKIKRK